MLLDVEAKEYDSDKENWRSYILEMSACICAPRLEEWIRSELD